MMYLSSRWGVEKEAREMSLFRGQHVQRPGVAGPTVRQDGGRHWEALLLLAGEGPYAGGGQGQGPPEALISQNLGVGSVLASGITCANQPTLRGGDHPGL